MAAGENRLVSVIIPTYNNAGLLPYTLESVLGQSYSPLDFLLAEALMAQMRSAEAKGGRGSQG